MKIVPLIESRPIDRLEFTDIAQTEWRNAKAAYLDAHRRMNSLMDLLHKAGDVKVAGRVTGAAYEAKKLRADVDKIIEALDEIVTAGRSVGA